MEIYCLELRFVENHDRILPEIVEKDDQMWKNAVLWTNAWKSVISASYFERCLRRRRTGVR